VGETVGEPDKSKEVGNCKPPIEHRYSKDNLPTKEERKRGGETQRFRTRLKKPINKYLNMTFEEFAKIQDDLKDNPGKYQMIDIAAINYVANVAKKFNYIVDHRDRTEGRAIQKQEIVADIETKVEGEVDVNEKISMDLSDEKAAEILSILAQAGAIKSEAKRASNSKTLSLDKDKTDT